MFKIACLSVATGVIALSAAVPVVGAGSRTFGEPVAMLLVATAFFGLASVMQHQGKGPRR